MIGRVLFLAMFANAYTMQSGAGVTPVQKVIQLMKSMEAKAVQEKQDEEVAFTTFKGWCDSTTRQRQTSVKEAEELMEQLTADIQKAASDVTRLTDEIQAVDAEIGEDLAEKKAATEVRADEKETYHSTHADYSASIDSVDHAVGVLKNGASLLQKTNAVKQVAGSSRLTEDAREAFMSFIQMSAPVVADYEFKSGGILDTMDSMKDKFEDERKTLESEEVSKKQGYQMLAQTLSDQVERKEEEKGRKERTKAQREEDGANAKGELSDTTASRDADQKYLDDTVAGCTMKSQDFESRQQLRAEELVAITKAIEIISSGSVSGAADSHLPAFALRRSAAMSPRQQQASLFLQNRAESIHSKMLTLLATKCANDPFVKVKTMIKEMIVRLMEEASEESEHKGWCDGELGANEITRESKTESVNSLTANVDELTAGIAKLAQNIADNSASIAELDTAVKEATEIRQNEKAKNTVAVADAQEASAAVGQALTVLKEFYAKAAEATALMQGAMDDAPSTFDSGFNGQQAEAGGVVSMLEVIASDFARLESDTATSEEQAASEYKTFSSDSAIDRATKAADMDNADKLKTRKSGELEQTKKDLKATQGELDAALAYYDKLRPTCVDAGVNYEDRVQRREDEIQSLKEALEILSGDDI